MDKRDAFLRLLLVAFVVIFQCLACQPDPSESVSKDGLRSNFKDLIAANPNYFGNAPESNQSSVFPLSYDTQYEQLISIGFNPILSVLEATIEIKLWYGFGGDLCSNGSLEYVRFYVSYGEQWNDLGAVTVNTHDIPDVLDCSDTFVLPLFYVLTLPFQPSPQQNCSVPQLPEIRAILSWNQLPPPSSPYWPPVYGNTVGQHIQSPTLPLPPPAVDSTLCIPLEDNILTERSDSQEPLHYPPGPTDQQHVLSEEPSSTLSLGGIPRPGRPKNIWFEELIGLGIDYDLDRIVATIRIKRRYGFGTGLCQNGSFEYIAIWADWYNTCNWTYLGLLTINVHNVPNIPPDGLTYSAALPVDLRNVSNFCNTTRISRVRAALSWNTPPPAPPKVAVRGNWLQTHVQIQPYTVAPNLTNPVIYTIGSVSIQEIDVYGSGMTFPKATFVGLFTSHGDPLPTDHDWAYGQTRPCPFGGSIYITGPTIGAPSTFDGEPSQYQYRVVYRPYGSTAEPNPVLNPISVTQAAPPFTHSWPPLNAQGYFYYLSSDRNYYRLLSRWTAPTRGLYQIRLEIATQTSPGGQIPATYKTEGATDWYNVLVNDANNLAGPKGTFTFTNEPFCGTFPAGTLLEGTLSAESPYFASYQVQVANSGVAVVVDDGNYPAFGFTELPYPGVDWSWDSSGVEPCGYIIELTVCDLTIYESVPYETRCVPVGGTGFCVSAALG